MTTTTRGSHTVQRFEPTDAVPALDAQPPVSQPPMTQQSTYGLHGYDMYPQGFVRLSGCQEFRLQHGSRDKRRALQLS